MSTKLSQGFFARPAVAVAQDLVGKVLVHSLSESTLRGRIVETEAYIGESDPGSHAYKGLTRRNKVMFGLAGRLYIYVSYGMHHCMNVVTDGQGIASAVLLRAVEPLEGIDTMKRLRGLRPVTDLSNGPGKLCQAFGIGMEQYGADLENSNIWIEDDGFRTENVGVSTRIGLSAGRELPFRFFLEGSPFLSKGKPSAALTSS